MQLSAVICTRNRPRELERALRSLVGQELPANEIIVIDNAPTSDVVRRLIRRCFPKVRYLREPVQGLDFARNRAIREAREEIVAFLDDDAVADKGWAGEFLEVFRQEGKVALCTGRVEPLTLTTEAARLFEKNGGFGRGLERIHLPADSAKKLGRIPAPLIAWAISVGNGASFAIRRRVALKIGGFDEALDLGEALPGGGDLDMFWRILWAGYELVYVPTALAWHEHRQELGSMFMQLAGHQQALVAFLVKTCSRVTGPARLPVLVFLCWRLAKPGVRLAARYLGKDPLPPTALFKMWRGAVKGLWTYGAAGKIARKRREAIHVT